MCETRMAASPRAPNLFPSTKKAKTKKRSEEAKSSITTGDEGPSSSIPHPHHHTTTPHAPRRCMTDSTLHGFVQVSPGVWRKTWGPCASVFNFAPAMRFLPCLCCVWCCGPRTSVTFDDGSREMILRSCCCQEEIIPYEDLDEKMTTLPNPGRIRRGSSDNKIEIAATETFAIFARGKRVQLGYAETCYFNAGEGHVFREYEASYQSFIRARLKGGDGTGPQIQTSDIVLRPRDGSKNCTDLEGGDKDVNLADAATMTGNG